MNKFALHAAVLVLVGPIAGIAPSARANYLETADPPAPVADDRLSQADLQELLGPIALYPDTMLANVMAASCYPDELKKAGAYIDGGGDPTKIPDQTWEPSVKAVAKVPDVLIMLNDNADWAAAIGQAYVVQSQDVMNAVQILRAKAQANGALKTSPQQTVVEQGSTIVIESPAPEVVYVPSYNPSVVYVDNGPTYAGAAAASVISFGVGVAVGAAFNDYDCDWNGGCVGWGGNDVDIDRDVNIEGDVNIGSGNTNIENRKNSVNKTDVQNRAKTGKEGQAFKPNQQKMAASGAGGTKQLSQFKGSSAAAKSGTPRVPQTSSVAGSSRQGGGQAARTSPQSSARSGATGGGKSASNLPSKNLKAPNSAQQAKKPLPKGPSAVPSASGDRSRDASPSRSGGSSAKSGSRERSSSGFSPSGGAGAASSRGSASRSGGGGGRSGGGRSGGGGRGR